MDQTSPPPSRSVSHPSTAPTLHSNKHISHLNKRKLFASLIFSFVIYILFSQLCLRQQKDFSLEIRKKRKVLSVIRGEWFFWVFFHEDDFKLSCLVASLSLPQESNVRYLLSPAHDIFPIFFCVFDFLTEFLLTSVKVLSCLCFAGPRAETSFSHVSSLFIIFMWIVVNCKRIWRGRIEFHAVKNRSSNGCESSRVS